MKKAIVVGGASGIGLALAEELMEKKYLVYIFDQKKPIFENNHYIDKFKFYPCQLLDQDYYDLKELSKDLEVDTLILTAGFGRVCEFDELSMTEIDHLIRVNALANIQIIKLFYTRISSSKNFYTAVMGSIAGLVSSPLFSVYAASKAAICRAIESINIELEMQGVSNRILNVSPGSIKGTCFNGNQTELQKLKPLANCILKQMVQRNALYIPDYAKTFQHVIEEYHKSAHDFGLQSYQYKMQSGRKSNKHSDRIGYLSGTFDLFHIGHLNLLRRAKAQCDYLIVGVHPDASHKGKQTFIPFDERKEIVGSIKYVNKVVESCREDSDAWNLWHYDVLFVGSDYKGSDRFNQYEKILRKKGVEIVYFPYTQSTSSTQIREAILKSK